MTCCELYFTQLEDLNNYISLRKKIKHFMRPILILTQLGNMIIKSLKPFQQHTKCLILIKLQTKVITTGHIEL